MALGDRITVVQASAADLGGGAERVASDLHHAYRRRGVDAYLAVGHAFTEQEGVVEIPNDANRSPWARAVLVLQPGLPAPHTAPSAAARAVRRIVKAVAEPGRAWARSRGFEDFEYPATRMLPDVAGHRADVLHVHSFHGGYFDLRALPDLSHALPTVVTPHDTWVTSGHCAYSLDCTLWQTGCGSCPRLDVLPGIPRDKTAENWSRKRDIFRRSQVHVAAPSRWVLGELERSIFADAIATSRVIPNGVDLDVFRPADRLAVRRRLGLPADAFVLVFSTASESNPYKDFPSICRALPAIARQAAPAPVVLVAIGAHAPEVDAPNASVVSVPYLAAPGEVAAYLQAADVCLHMAHAENHPLVVIEAQACGAPIVVSDVGGVSEIVADGETGLLVRPSDDVALAGAVLSLLSDPDRRRRMGSAAALRAAEHFSLDRMADDYLELYAVLSAHRGGTS